MDAAQLRALAKVRKCLDLADDVRGNPTVRETALRQARALMARYGLELRDGTPVVATAKTLSTPAPSSPEWRGHWAVRTTAEALQAGVGAPVLCRDGWYVPDSSR